MMNEGDLRGLPVFDDSGAIGRVVDVAGNSETEHDGDLWIRLEGQDRPVRVPRDLIREATPDRIMLAVSRDRLLSGDQTIRVPLHEEVLEASTREVERGRVRVHKTVETVPHEETLSVGRDDISVDRVRIDQMVDQPPQPRWEGETLIVPLVEEVLVVEKRLRVREELRVTRRHVTEQRTVHEDLRREVADIETTGQTGIDDAE